jgi:hypothetical protein
MGYRTFKRDRAALEPTLADSNGIERFSRIFQAASRVPILIRREADRGERARKAVQGRAPECQIKNPACSYGSAGRCA